MLDDKYSLVLFVNTVFLLSGLHQQKASTMKPLKIKERKSIHPLTSPTYFFSNHWRSLAERGSGKKCPGPGATTDLLIQTPVYSLPLFWLPWQVEKVSALEVAAKVITLITCVWWSCKQSCNVFLTQLKWVNFISSNTINVSSFSLITNCD